VRYDSADTVHEMLDFLVDSDPIELRDIARNLDKNINRSWTLILIPNLMCIAGAFTMGFGVMASVVTNNVAAMAALANGMLPLRRISKVIAEEEEAEESREFEHVDPSPRQIEAEFVRLDDPSAADSGEIETKAAVSEEESVESELAGAGA